jgi:hypothetical protein
MDPLRLRSGAGLMEPLLLFTRQGCCLCEGLLERLQALDPAPSLQLVDIDGDPALQARYGERVPLLALPAVGAQGLRELPWVPPRLAGSRLQEWLRQHGVV